MVLTGKEAAQLACGRSLLPAVCLPAPETILGDVDGAFFHQVATGKLLDHLHYDTRRRQRPMSKLIILGKCLH